MAASQAERETAVNGAASGLITIRRCEALDEMRACFALQKEVWSFTDAELVPVRIFVLATKIGGHVVGAFEGGQLIGFALAIPGMRHGHSYLHSHMLAVRQQYRNGGLGRRMKLFQRADALARGIELMEWTFDPLEIKNAWLNLEKLGAIARRYNINQYGMVSSALQGGLPTDRLIAEWWLRSRRVEHLLKTGTIPESRIESTVTVPAEIYEWKNSPSMRDRALEVQARNRGLLREAFLKGLAAVRYQRDERGNGSFLLGHWDEKFSYGAQ